MNIHYVTGGRGVGGGWGHASSTDSVEAAPTYSADEL